MSRRTLLASTGATLLCHLQPFTSAEANHSASGVNLSGHSRLTPEQEQGPFYIERQLMRSDIREDRPGVPLEIAIILLDSVSGMPLKNSAVDIWHCDAGGTYSGFAQMAEMGPSPFEPGHKHNVAFGHPFDRPMRPMSEISGDLAAGKSHRSNNDRGFGDMHAPGRPPKIAPTDERTFLRGTQISDETGLARFKTVYPGWYPGRTLHVHLKVHTGGTITGAEHDGPRDHGAAQSATVRGYAGGHVCHTGQLFFPEQITAAVALAEPYSNSKIQRMLLADDMVFGPQSGAASMLSMSRLSSIAGFPAFSGVVRLMIDPNATPSPA